MVGPALFWHRGIICIKSKIGVNDFAVLEQCGSDCEAGVFGALRVEGEGPMLDRRLFGGGGGLILDVCWYRWLLKHFGASVVNVVAICEVSVLFCGVAHVLWLLLGVVSVARLMPVLFSVAWILCWFLGCLGWWGSDVGSGGAFPMKCYAHCGLCAVAVCAFV